MKKAELEQKIYDLEDEIRKTEVLGCTPVVCQGLKDSIELGYDMPMAYRLYAREWKAKK